MSADLLCISFSKVGFHVCSLLAKKTGTYLSVLSDLWEPDFAKTMVESWVAYLCRIRNVSKSISPAHRSEEPRPLNPPQASVQPGNKNGEPETRGTREEDATPGGAQQSDACSGSRDTDEGQSPSVQPAARPMVSEAEPHPCSQGLKHPHHCQPPDKPHPATQARFQPLKGSSSGVFPRTRHLGIQHAEDWVSILYTQAQSPATYPAFSTRTTQMSDGGGIKGGIYTVNIRNIVMKSPHGSSVWPNQTVGP